MANGKGGSFRRAAVLLVLLPTVAAAGCGGLQSEDSSQVPPAQAPAVAKPAAPEAKTPPGALPSSEPPGTAALLHSQRFAVSSTVAIERRALGHVRELRAAKQTKADRVALYRARARVEAVRDLADAVLVQAGLTRSTFAVGADASSVRVLADQRETCLLGPEEPTVLAQQIRTADPKIVRVAFGVIGTRLTLAQYRAHHCHRAARHPGPAGTPVYSRLAEGIVQTPEIAVKQKRWTLDYLSRSSVMQIYLYENGRLVRRLLSQAGRVGGTLGFNGPARFALRIAATGRWRVTVRDG